MINEFSKIFIKAKFEALARKNNVDFSTFFSYVNQPITNVHDNANFVGNYSIKSIRNLFNTTEERVCIKDFESGFRPDMSDTLFSSVISIDRNQTILDMIQENPQSLIKSLEQSPITMLEINGKFYAENDGNHRLMALKILYLLEKSKNIDFDESKFSFVTRVKHINHSNKLIESLAKLNQKQKASLFHDYLTNKIAQQDSIYNVIRFDKNSGKYAIEYQGQQFNNLNEQQTIKLLNSLHNEKPYSVYKINDGYALEFGNMLIECATKEKLNDSIKNLNQEKTVFSHDYQIIKKENKFDLTIKIKTIFDNVENLKKIYSAAVTFNQNQPLQVMAEQKTDCEILSEEQINKIYFDNLDFIDVDLTDTTPFVKINERVFENLTKEELDIRLNQLSKERLFCKPNNFVLKSKNEDREKSM